MGVGLYAEILNGAARCGRCKWRYGKSVAPFLAKHHAL